MSENYLSQTDIDRIAGDLWGASEPGDAWKQDWIDEWDYYKNHPECRNDSDYFWGGWNNDRFGEDKDCCGDPLDYSEVTEADKEEIYNRIIELYEEDED